MGPSVIGRKFSEASIYLIPSISPSPLTLLLLLSSQRLPPSRSLQDRTINVPPCLLSSPLPPLSSLLLFLRFLRWLKLFFCCCYFSSHESLMRPERGAPRGVSSALSRWVCGGPHAACVISLFARRLPNIFGHCGAEGERFRETKRLNETKNKKKKID